MADVTTSRPRDVPISALPPAIKISSSNDSPRSSSNTSNEKVNFSSPAVQKSPSPPYAVSSRHPDRSASPGRWKSFRNAFHYLYDLTPKQVDDFMASYVIYNLDWENEPDMIATLGPDYRERVGDCLKAYYGVLNHLDVVGLNQLHHTRIIVDPLTLARCALGDVEKMYIPPLMDKKASVKDNQLLNEEMIAREIGLKRGDRVLDLGCGRGRVAAHMTSFSGAQVIGLNIDPDQVAQARLFNQECGFQNEFVERDQNELPLPFEDESFDAFYEIQALSLCKDPRSLFREIFRILKPGAKFCLVDWVSLEPYDADNEEHAELMRRVKPLIGAVGTPTPASFESALRDAGFTVTRSDIPSIDGLQAPLIDKVDIYFRTMRQLILAAVKLHILPKHFKILINRFCLDGPAFVKMDYMRLITTTYRIVAEKPQAQCMAICQ